MGDAAWVRGDGALLSGVLGALVGAGATPASSAGGGPPSSSCRFFNLSCSKRLSGCSAAGAAGAGACCGCCCGCSLLLPAVKVDVEETSRVVVGNGHGTCSPFSESTAACWDAAAAMLTILVTVDGCVVVVAVVPGLAAAAGGGAISICRFLSLSCSNLESGFVSPSPLEEGVTTAAADSGCCSSVKLGGAPLFDSTSAPFFCCNSIFRF
mmetsp:Transcript_785/g.1475  ORF Transcript_785/g.1475 Transcript_785/m.1475 type:complete len:210 (-) Transcript_785:426-1055(-)